MNYEMAWDELAESVVRKDAAKAAEKAKELLEWLRGGGNPPCITEHEDFDVYVVGVVCARILEESQVMP